MGCGDQFQERRLPLTQAREEEMKTPSFPGARDIVQTSGHTNTGSDPSIALNELSEDEHITSISLSLFSSSVHKDNNDYFL